MCIWVGLSSFGIKHARLLNTPYVKNLVDNNILYVVPEDVHREIMSSQGHDYIMKSVVNSEYINRNIGRVRSIDANNHMVEIDVNPEFKDYIESMENPRISFLAYTGLGKTSPVMYIHNAMSEDLIEGAMIV